MVIVRSAGCLQTDFCIAAESGGPSRPLYFEQKTEEIRWKIQVRKRDARGTSLHSFNIAPYVGIIQIRLRVETVQPPLSRLMPAPRDDLKFSGSY